jgi:carboxymethylenebutenolidase
MEHQHGGEAPTPSPATVPEPAKPVITEEVVYATLDGVPVKGYLARPKEATGPLPGLLVIQEWWGLNDNIRATARRLAGEGYVALAVDLYEGQLATDSAQAMALMNASLEKSARLMDNLKQARAFLATRAQPTRLGVVGWCFGGAWTLESALAFGGDIRAAVMYYGRVKTDPKELAALKAPLLGLFGGKDQGIPVDGVRQMEQELQKLGKEATIVVYPDADHAFANPSGARYDAAAAADAWAKTVAFFAAHLKP